MNIRCANCELEFAYDPPPFASSGTARCPRCGHGNDVKETGGGGGAGAAAAGGSGGGEGGADQVFCFNCGKPMQANPQELIPVCTECKAGSSTATGSEEVEPPPVADPDSEGSAAELMVRKSNGQVYGPFPEETIVEWIRAGKIHPDEEVSKIGGAWRMFSKHDQFSSYFPDVKRPTRAESQDVQFKKVSAAREAVRSLTKVSVALLFLVVVGIVVYYLVSRGTLAIPESVIGQASDAIQNVADENGDPGGGTGRADELIAALQAKYPEAEGASFEHYYRARESMARGNVSDLHDAMVAMETAVALDPDNAAALAGLGQVYTTLAHEDEAFSSLLNDSFYFIDHALEMREYELEANRAKAWFLYYTDNLDKATQHVGFALEVAPDDPESHMLMGMCSHGQEGAVRPGVLAHFTRALEVAPGFDQAHYQLGLCYEADRRYNEALDEFTAKIESDPTYIGAHLHVGQLYEAIGDYEGAVDAYERVTGMDPANKLAIFRLGRIHTQVTGDARRAASLYQRLVDSDVSAGLSRAERLELATGRASALRQAGNAAAACEAADEALAVDDASIIAHFEKGMCEHAGNDIDAASRAFSQAVALGSDLPDEDLALLEFFRGVAYFEAGQYPDASESFERVVTLDAGYLPGIIYRAGLFAKLGQFDRVKGSLRVMQGADPLGYRRAHRVRALWAPVPSMSGICRDIGTGLVDVNFDPELFGLAGGVCYHAGDTERATRYLERSLADDPRGWAPLLYEGLLAMDRGDMTKAGTRIEALTSEHREVPVFFLIEGDLALATGDLGAAERAFNHVIRFRKDLAWGHSQLGQVYARLERPEDAKRAFKAAIEADPELTGPYLGMFEHRI